MSVPPKTSPRSQVGIIGLGSFGVLLAELLLPFAEVKGYSRRGKLPGIPSAVGQASLEKVCASDIIIIASELTGLEAVCQEIKPHVKPRTLVMDVCSVKIKPAEIMTRVLGNSCQLLATHPLFGPLSVKNKGIKGQKIVVHELSRDALKPVKTLLKTQLGLTVISMAPEEHDKSMAWVHSLTFFVGRGLLMLNPPADELATVYYDQLLKLVDIERTQSLELFKTVEVGNPFSKQMRQNYLNALKELDDQLESED